MTATRPQPASWTTDLRLVGEQLEVPLVTGAVTTYAHLDYAATAPCLQVVANGLTELLPWYASVHRSAGYPSQVCTALYEHARDTLRGFLGCSDDDAVIFTRNTTDALNLLSRAMPGDVEVYVFETEHHANLLAWDAARTTRLPAPSSPDAAAAMLGSALGRRRSQAPALVCVTGASNVTGEIWPVRRLAAIAHRYGARLVLDAAQLAPHRPVTVTDWGVDYIALSGQKMYAPFGAGVLAGRADWLAAAEPYLAGGGATLEVGDSAVTWAGLPARHEGGSPNVVGAVALAAACHALRGADRTALVAEEEMLTARLRAGLAEVTGVHDLSLWDETQPRVGIVTFVVEGWDGGRLAAVLSAEYGIGVRHGRFCAHPFLRHLRDRVGAIRTAGSTDGGAVRASLGIGTTVEHVDRLVAAVRRITTRGSRWRYVQRDGTHVPDPDPRRWPGDLDAPHLRDLLAVA